jgi:hypothetical protein
MRQLEVKTVFVLALVSFLGTGCIGGIRETTTTRTATEQILISTAAERAIAGFENVDHELRGKRVAIDDARFESVDKAYAMSAVRHYCSEHGAILVPLVPAKGKDKDGKEIELSPPPQRVLEVRNGGLGINDTSWGIGIPAFPLAVPSMPVTSMTPPLYLFYRGKQEGWAKFQFWIYDPLQDTYVAKSRDLWGHTYYSKWYFFGCGPFDFSNDIYPEDDQVNTGEPRTGDQPSKSAEASQKKD